MTVVRQHFASNDISLTAWPILVKLYRDVPLSKLFKEINSMRNSGFHDNGKENFKNLLVKKYWPDLKQNWQNCAFDDPLLRLCKLF